jgi:RNA polymerase sigma factor (sigma-70 family)
MMLTGASNGELIDYALGHGPTGSAAWNELVKRHSRAVWKALWTCPLSSEDREDLFQSTWTRALESLAQVREPDRIHVWLMTIARNEAMSWLKKASRTQPTDEIEQLPTLAVEDDQLVKQERHDVVGRAMRRLGEDCQNLIRLLTVDPPMAYREIEELMGWSDGGTSIRRARCIDKLRATPEVSRYMASLDDFNDRTKPQ